MEKILSTTARKKADEKIEAVINQFKNILNNIKGSTTNGWDPFMDRSTFATDTEIEIDKEIDCSYFWDKLKKRAEEENISITFSRRG